MPERREYVYLIGSLDNTLVKIGRSIDVKERLATLQRMSPAKLAILWQTRGGAELETALHRKFRAVRSHGEWFDFPERDAPAQVMSALSQIAQEEQDALRRGLARTSVKATLAIERKAAEVWTPPEGPRKRKVYPGSRMSPFRVGEVVRIIRKGWRYSQTGVIEDILGGDHPFMVVENDGRRHWAAALFTKDEIARQNAVAKLPRGEFCRLTGCMCANVV